jgi:glycosyltransferase, group 2 family
MNSSNMGKMATAGEGLSVLISVYRKTNAEYLHKALLSVWDEQSYQPSEIVLVQDGPVGASIIKN